MKPLKMGIKRNFKICFCFNYVQEDCLLCRRPIIFVESTSPPGSSPGSRPGSGGPGLGIRLIHWQHAPKTSPVLVDPASEQSKQSARIEKFMSLLSNPQLDISKFVCVKCRKIGLIDYTLLT